MSKEEQYEQFVIDMAHELPFRKTQAEKLTHPELYINYIKLVKLWNTYQLRANRTMDYAINAGGSKRKESEEE